MSLPAAFKPFAEGAPCAVIARLCFELLVEDRALRRLFHETAEDQYERSITITDLVYVMLDVVCSTRPTVRSAFLRREDEIAASIKAFYGKLNRTETRVSEAIVRHTARIAGQIIRAMKGTASEPVPGYATLILDGNMLTGTEHRIAEMRHTRAAALPGKLLAVFECATEMITDVLLHEDAHDNELTILPRFAIPEGVHILADRNFCVRWFLQNITAARAFFTIRRHKGMFPLTVSGQERRRGGCATGRVFEQTIVVTDDDGTEHRWRKVRIELDKPTRDGDTEITLISNLPADVSARVIAQAYLDRWRIEGHFQRLTQWLNCEVPTLGYPRAALFAFAMSVVAGQALALLIAALRAAKGNDLASNVSYMMLVDEIAATYRGMMLALPSHRWRFVETMTVPQAAALLRDIARHADPRRLRKTTRGPKQPRRSPNCKRVRHLSTHRVLERSRK
jgi:hypothetical protein